jgi:hypothetical protein
MIVEESIFYDQLSPVLQQRLANQLFSPFTAKFGLFFAEMEEGFVN